MIMDGSSGGPQTTLSLIDDGAKSSAKRTCFDFDLIATHILKRNECENQSRPGHLILSSTFASMPMIAPTDNISQEFVFAVVRDCLTPYLRRHVVHRSDYFPLSPPPADLFFSALSSAVGLSVLKGA